MPDAFMTVHRQLIILLAARYSLPAIYPYRYQAAEGGLLERSLLELRAAEQSASGRISTTVGVTTTPLPEAPKRANVFGVDQLNPIRPRRDPRTCDGPIG
jgi:hypothetical protein